MLGSKLVLYQLQDVLQWLQSLFDQLSGLAVAYLTGDISLVADSSRSLFQSADDSTCRPMYCTHNIFGDKISLLPVCELVTIYCLYYSCQDISDGN